MEIDGIPIIQDLGTALPRLLDDPVIAIDCESTGLSPWKDSIALIQLYGPKTGTLALIKTPNGAVPEALHELFHPDCLMVAHNGVGFDIQMLATHGVPWNRARWYDTLVGETVVVSSGRRDVRVNLGATVKRRLGIKIDKDIEHGSWANELTEKQLAYAARDVLYTPALMKEQVNIARRTEQLNALKLEQRLVPVFAQMTLNGLPLAVPILESYLADVSQQAEEAAEMLFTKFGDELNLNSWQQVKAVLGEVGAVLPNTRRETLEEYAKYGGPGVEYVRAILNYRQPAQRQKMYGGSWAERFLVDGWVHPRFWPVGTDTARVSSSDPNLQQVPRDSRWIFGNLDGYKIVSADYSQIEVRGAAYVAQDNRMLELLELDDVHRAVAADTLLKAPEDVTDDERKFSKAMTFTMLFGGSANTLYNYAHRAGSDITIGQAEQLFTSFFDRFSGLALERQRAEAMARRRSPVISIRLLNGLRRQLVGDKRRSSVIINTKVQGNAAIGLKYGILEADQRGLTKYLGATVHDELVAAVPSDEAADYAAELEDAMIVGMQKLMPITIKVDIKIGDNWQQ